MAIKEKGPQKKPKVDGQKTIDSATGTLLKTWGELPMLRRGKQFLFHNCQSSCYFCLKEGRLFVKQRCYIMIK